MCVSLAKLLKKKKKKRTPHKCFVMNDLEIIF